MRRSFAIALYLLLAALVAALIWLRSYTPDPYKNEYDGFVPELVTPDHAGGENSFFSGQTQSADRYNFLIVGLDRVSRSTDIMMIVSYDVRSGRINVVQIPRDTYMKTSFVKTVNKINSYYAFFYNRARSDGDDDPDGVALTNLAALIEETFCVRLNYCAVVDLDGFENIVDAVGGVWLDIPCDMHYEDPYQDLYIDLHAGYQHLDGNLAMQFVRFRKGYVEQDIGRQNALKNFMSALLSQLKENMSAATVTKVSGEVMENMRSNISAADFVYFAKSALSVELSDVLMTTLPGATTTIDGASVYVLYRDDTVAALNKYLNVFEKDITKGYFDPDAVMVKPGDTESMKIYESPLGTSAGTEYNAEDVNKEPIDIPRS